MSEEVRVESPAAAGPSEQPASQPQAGLSACPPVAATQAGDAQAGKISQIVALVSQLNLIEAAELVKALEQKFGVSAAPMAAAVAAPAAGPAQAEEQKATFDVVLKTVGEQKLQVIKAVRQFTDLGLKEAKALVESAPKAVKEGVSKEEAEKVKAELEKAGAGVELK